MQSQHANFVDNYYFGEGIGELKGKIVLFWSCNSSAQTNHISQLPKRGPLFILRYFTFIRWKKLIH